MKHRILVLFAALLVLTGCVSVIPSGLLTSGGSGPASPSAAPSTSPAPHRFGAPILTWAGDLAGSTMTSQVVAALSGTAGTVDVKATALQADSANSSLTFGTNKAGAVLNLESGAASPTMTLDSSGTNGDAVLSDGTVVTLRCGHYNGGTTYMACWPMDGGSPGPNNFIFLSNGNGYTAINAAGGGNLYFAVSNLNFVTLSNTLFSSTLPVTFGSTTGTNTFTGGANFTTRTVTASFTVDTTTTDNTIKADTTSAAFTITLVAPPSGASRVISLLNPGTWATHNLTLSGGASYTINGSSSKVLSGTEQLCHLQSDGSTTAWFTDCQ